jgi:hypothetical protein
MVNLDNIDQNKDIKIDLGEINESLKTPDWFLSNEENIISLKTELEKTEKSDLLSSLETSLDLWLINIETKISPDANDILILELCSKLYSGKKLAKLKNRMTNLVWNISHSVNRNIWKNEEGNADYYNVNQIKSIQLRANTNFWENLELNWERWNLFYASTNNENKQKTNTYI